MKPRMDASWLEVLGNELEPPHMQANGLLEAGGAEPVDWKLPLSGLPGGGSGAA